MRNGFTLVELVFIIAVLGILAGIGWGQLSQHAPRYRMIKTAKAFRTELGKLRQMAIASNRETRIRLVSHGNCSNPSDWGGKWEMAIGDKALGSTQWDLLPEDTYDDGTDDQQGLGVFDIGKSGEQRAKDVCLKNWGSLTGPSVGGASNQDSIVFNPRGWVANPASDFSANGTIEFHFVNQAAARENRVDQFVISMSRAGMMRLVAYKDQYPDNPAGVNQSSSAL